MASATDIITYVGVPLTVMGIMPILWNFLKAFLIRFRLSQTIPWELRPFYTLSADAANGDVTVVIDSISCVHPGLWPSEKTGVQYTLSPGMMFKRWSHRVFYRLIYKCEPIYTEIFSMWNKFIFRWFPSIQEHICFSDSDAENQVGELAKENQSLPAVWTWSDNSISLKPKAFCLDEPDLLFRPWMAAAAKLGLCIHKESEYSHGLFLKRPALRFTVSMDMEIPKNPALAMDGTHLLWLALALGVDPFYFDPTKPNFNDNSRHGLTRPIMRFFENNGDWHFELTRNAKKQQYSVRRALAWVNVECYEGDKTIHCRPLGSPESEEAPLSSKFYSVDHLNEFRYRHSNPENNQRALAAALKWGFYELGFRRGLGSKEVDLPVSQWMLEIRQRSLCYLHGLEKDGLLLPKLESLFCRIRLIIAVHDGEPDLSNDASGTPSTGPNTSYKMEEYTGAPLAMEEWGSYCRGHSRETELKEKDNRSEENQENVSPAKSPHEEVIGQEVNTETVEMFHDFLQREFERSAYAKRSHYVGKSLRRILESLKDCQNDSVSESKAREAAEVFFAELEKDYKQPLQPGSYFMRLGSPSVEEILLERIFRHDKFQKLQELLKKYGNAQAEVGAWDDDSTCLAHVIMGCKMWDMLQCEFWEVDENVVSDMQQIRQKLEDPSVDADALSQILEEAAGRAECGIYAAPKEPICDLFEKFRSKGTVYLI